MKFVETALIFIFILLFDDLPLLTVASLFCYLSCFYLRYGSKRLNVTNAAMSQNNASPVASQSIIVPESPGSPNILEPASPPSDSETYTEPNRDIPRNEESNDSIATVPYDMDNPRPDSGQRIDFEDSNSLHNDNTRSTIVNEESNSLMSLPESRARRSQHDDGPPAKVRKISDSRDDEADGEMCPICLDPWGNSGDHRLVALKCGHLFGSQCVERWLRAQAAKERSCPTCKSKATMKDLRCIYARRLVAADTSQITTLQNQIETLQAEKSKAELELQKSKIAHRACLLQLEVLQSTLMKSQVNTPPVRANWRFSLEKNKEISRDGGCRVLTYNCRTYELYVSQKSTNNLFPGYGIRKVSCVDYKLGQFLHLHPKPIRDITYSQPRDLLLSVGLDKTARIVEKGMLGLNITVNATVPLWSCSWDYMRSSDFYVGGVSGVIQHYDLRNPSVCLNTMNTPHDMSPVVSLCSTEFGLLSCHFNSCWLWMNVGQRWELRALPVTGPFMSLCYDNESQRALITSRPSTTGVERSKLTLCKLKASAPSGEVLFDVEDTFNGSSRCSLMSRPAWVRAPGVSWAAAHSESDSCLYLHGLDGARTFMLPAADPALDVCSMQMNGTTLVAALSETRLKMYKAVTTNS